MDYNLSKSRFLNSIDKYARKKCLKLTEEIRQIENEKLLKEEARIIEQAKFLMMSELADVKNKISLKIYKEQAFALQKICKRRSDIENEIFDLCKERVEKFTQSEKYLDKLKYSLEYATKFFDDSFIVFSREKDILCINKIKNLFKIDDILVSKKIKIGGLIFKKGNLVLDDSFDYYLKEQHVFFSREYLCKLV